MEANMSRVYTPPEDPLKKKYKPISTIKPPNAPVNGQGIPLTGYAYGNYSGDPTRMNSSGPTSSVMSGGGPEKRIGNSAPLGLANLEIGKGATGATQLYAPASTAANPGNREFTVANPSGIMTKPMSERATELPSVDDPNADTSQAIITDTPQTPQRTPISLGRPALALNAPAIGLGNVAGGIPSASELANPAQDPVAAPVRRPISFARAPEPTPAPAPVAAPETTNASPLTRRPISMGMNSQGPGDQAPPANQALADLYAANGRTLGVALTPEQQKASDANESAQAQTRRAISDAYNQSAEGQDQLNRRRAAVESRMPISNRAQLQAIRDQQSSAQQQAQARQDQQEQQARQWVLDKRKADSPLDVANAQGKTQVEVAKLSNETAKAVQEGKSLNDRQIAELDTFVKKYQADKTLEASKYNTDGTLKGKQVETGGVVEKAKLDAAASGAKTGQEAKDKEADRLSKERIARREAAAGVLREYTQATGGMITEPAAQQALLDKLMSTLDAQGGEGGQAAPVNKAGIIGAPRSAQDAAFPANAANPPPANRDGSKNVVGQRYTLPDNRIGIWTGNSFKL
jgi:hypothetical protein